MVVCRCLKHHQLDFSSITPPFQQQSTNRAFPSTSQHFSKHQNHHSKHEVHQCHLRCRHRLFVARLCNHWYAITTSNCRPILTIAVSYDTGYDDKSRSLTAVACSDGANGLITKYGWQTQGQIKTPYIGGYQGIAGWNSPQVRYNHVPSRESTNKF
jgi:hypothetical protein